MRTNLQVVAKLSFVHALSNFKIHNLSEEGDVFLKSLYLHTLKAINKWPVKYTKKDLETVNKAMILFFDRIGWNDNNDRPVDVQICINFALAQMESILAYIKDYDRRSMLLDIIHILNKLYQIATELDGEIIDHIKEGLKYHEYWEEAMAH